MTCPLSPGEVMEQKMLAKLNGTWRTWTSGEPFSLITYTKPLEWTPNYWKMLAGGQGRVGKPYPEVRNLVNGTVEKAADEATGQLQEVGATPIAQTQKRRPGARHHVERQGRNK